MTKRIKISRMQTILISFTSINKNNKKNFTQHSLAEHHTRNIYMTQNSKDHCHMISTSDATTQRK